MRKTQFVLALASLAVGTTLVLAPAAYAADAPATHYSVETTLIGKLIDDPAAASILKDLIP